MPKTPKQEPSTRARVPAEIGEWDFKLQQSLVKPSLLEKIGVGALVGALPIVAAAKIPGWYFGDTDKKLSKHLQVELGKFVGRYTNINQMRIFVPPQPLRKLLDSPLLARASRNSNDYNKIFKVPNASARWLVEVPDRKPSDPVILYLHGGGYMLTTMPQQVAWLLSFARRTSDLRISVLAVDYTVSPNARWPTQLEETLAVYEQLRKSCESIITLGDSAGGHLALNLNDYLHTNSQKKPFGVVLVSPWAELMPGKTGSYVANFRRDYLEISEYAPLLFASREQMSDPRVNPCRGDAQYWAGKLERACCVWGEWEVLADCCADISAKCGIVDTFVQPKGLHDALILNPKSTSADFIERCVRGWIAPSRPVPPIPAGPRI